VLHSLNNATTKFMAKLSQNSHKVGMKMFISTSIFMLRYFFIGFYLFVEMQLFDQDEILHFITVIPKQQAHFKLF